MNSVENGENLLGVRHITRVFLIWRVWARWSAIARFSYPGLHSNN